MVFINSSYGQDKNVEYEVIDVEGEVQEQEIPEEVIVDSPEVESTDKTRQEQMEKANQELEEVMKKNSSEIVEIKEEPEPPREIKEEVVEVKAPKGDPPRFYDFLFDESEKSLFKTEAKWKYLSLGLGGVLYFPNAYQTTSNSDKKNQDIQTAFEIGLEFGEVNRWSFIPYVGFVFPEKSDDGLFTQYRYNLGFEGAYRFTEKWRGKIGTTVLFTTIKGDDTKSIDLGGGQGTFFTNSGARTSIVNTIDLGLEYWINKFSIAWRSSIVSAFESEKQDYIHGIFLRYNFSFHKDEK